MTWKNILKKDNINELINKVRRKLDSFLLGNFMIDIGEWDDEMQGYRDASNFTHEDFTDSARKGGSIEVEPQYDHPDDSDITIEFDIIFDGFIVDENRKYHGIDLRLGSYTGSDGIYIASEDWEEYDREALELLDELLE
jgi:hypothetical protein